MLRFVLHKLISKKWLALCLLIGDILLVAVASSNPLYSDAILQRALTKTLSTSLSEKNEYPAEITVSRGEYNEANTRNEFNELVAEIRALPDKLGIPVVEASEEHSIATSKAVLQGVRSDGKTRSLSVGCMSDIQDHIEITAGTFMSESVTDGVIEAIVSEGVQRQKNYLIGDEFEILDLVQEDGTPYRIRIVGIYCAADVSDVYWNKRTSMLNSNILVPETVYKELVGEYSVTSRFSFYLDYTAIAPDQIDAIRSELAVFHDYVDDTNIAQISENLTTQLSAFAPKATQFNSTLIVLYSPIFALLAAFIFMVSRQLMDLEENEIAVIVSRGSRKWQIVMIYFLQALIMAVLGVVFGYPLGFLLCQMLGSSNAFLEFVQRQALPLQFSLNSFLFACGAAAVACIFMTMPVMRYSKRSIVQYKVQKQAQNNTPFWQKCFLDVILVGVSLYALYSFNNQKDNLVQKVILGEALDPLLYFSSSVFIIGAGLFCIRVLPYLIKVIYRIGKRFWSPSAYTALLRVIRTKNQQSFIMVFMILTIALGIFNSTTARSINGNAENRIEYLNAADVVVQEYWGTLDSGLYVEPDYDKYDKIEGVVSKTKVYYTENASISTTTDKISDIVLMGINTKEFGETVEFDTSLLSVHWYNYLNAMSQDASAIIVSSNFRDVKGYKLGDVINYRDGAGTTIQGVIYAFVDYWPGFAPTTVSVNEEGKVVEKSNYLIVASFSQLQVNSGLQPYQIWMKMEDSSQPVYDFAEENHIQFQIFQDKAADLISMKNEPLFQGTNGVLTANFIIVLMLCMVGFLIYWILSIRSRELQFGIFRAMGMSMREVISMLLVEQVLISGSAIAVGVGVGALVTRLYLPLIQIAYSAADQVLPLEMISNWGDSVRLFAVVGFMVIICMVILAWLISKIRIAQALKLGED